MDVEELLLKAWKAVEKSGVPESLYGVAFKEAADFIRSSAGTGNNGSRNTGKRKDGHRAVGRKAPEANGSGGDRSVPDLDTFFGDIVAESGVPDVDLRDVLNLTDAGQVQVTTPSNDLGRAMAEQAKTVIALVAGARSKGLAENPVNADAVRQELQRKHIYDRANFASYHLRPLKGFNAGANSSQILLTSKWVGEFKAAIDRAHGRTPTQQVT